MFIQRNSPDPEKAHVNNDQTVEESSKIVVAAVAIAAAAFLLFHTFVSRYEHDKFDDDDDLNVRRSLGG